MKLTGKQKLLISFMLFSMFFGAGNLIFPPFLGQNAASRTIPAVNGFLITAVVLPVLGVIVVAQSDGLNRLAGKVGPRFAFVFTMLIYLSIGPGLGIPRAASVPFEMAVAPYLPQDANLALYMLAYSTVFFIVAAWLALTPNKLMDRIGQFLTPSLLTLIVFLFVSFLIKGEVNVSVPLADYRTNPLLKGFCEGYQTMDTIAALNFGLVIATTLRSMGLSDSRDVIRYTKIAGLIAGSILTAVYLMLTYMGMASSGVYPVQENGAWTLRNIVYQLFAEPGAVLLAAIFTLACLTTCVGLITSISQYFSTVFTKISYRKFVFILTAFSLVICNQGLTAILSISVPVLNAIYPVSIVLIMLGLSDRHISGNRYIYPLTVMGTAVISIISAVDKLVDMGVVSAFCRSLPWYDLGFGWVSITAVMLIISMIADKVKK